MSSTIGSEGDPATLEHLVHCLSHWRLASSVAIASAALVFYDWLLTSSDEFDFLWQRGRTTCARVIFTLARYPALACAVVGVLPVTVTLNNVTTCLSVITIVSSEFILAMRTWAIWERSRPILVFLVILFIVCAAPAIVVIERDMKTSVVLAPAGWGGVKACRVQTSVIKQAWVLPYIGIMVFESAILSLTLYKVVRCYRIIPRKRSKLLDVLWIDGVIYFVFMFILGILNVGLALNVSVCCSIISMVAAFIDGCLFEGSATAGLMYTVADGRTQHTFDANCATYWQSVEEGFCLSTAPLRTAPNSQQEGGGRRV